MKKNKRQEQEPIAIFVRNIRINKPCFDRMCLSGKPERYIFINYYFQDTKSISRKDLFLFRHEDEIAHQIIIEEAQYQEILKKNMLDKYLKEKVVSGINQMLIVKDGIVSLNQEVITRIQREWDKLEIKKLEEK